MTRGFNQEQSWRLAPAALLRDPCSSPRLPPGTSSGTCFADVSATPNHAPGDGAGAHVLGSAGEWTKLICARALVVRFLSKSVLSGPTVPEGRLTGTRGRRPERRRARWPRAHHGSQRREAALGMALWPGEPAGAEFKSGLLDAFVCSAPCAGSSGRPSWARTPSAIPLLPSQGLLVP